MEYKNRSNEKKNAVKYIKKKKCHNINYRIEFIIILQCMYLCAMASIEESDGILYRQLQKH